MQTFPIVREISASHRRISGDSTRKGQWADTMQAIVRFPDGDTTRHLVRTDPTAPTRWTGWNSDSVLRQRAGTLESYKTHKAIAAATQERVSKIGSKIAELKGKKSVTEKRKLLKDALKVAKATLAVANSDLARVKVHADAIEHDGAFPEIVTFV